MTDAADEDDGEGFFLTPDTVVEFYEDEWLTDFIKDAVDVGWGVDEASARLVKSLVKLWPTQ